MELILTIFCLLLGGAYCEGQVAPDLVQPTAVVTAVATAVVEALRTPEPEAEPTPGAVRTDPYTPIDPDCVYADYYTLALSSIGSVRGATRARVCWVAENYSRRYLNYLEGCQGCRRTAYYRAHGRFPEPGENWYRNGEWMSYDEHYGTFRDVVASLDRYVAAVDACIERNPVAPAALARADRLTDQGLCGLEGRATNPGCRAALHRTVRTECKARLTRGALTSR